MQTVLDQMASLHAVQLGFNEAWAQLVPTIRECRATVAQRLQLRQRAVEMWGMDQRAPVWVPTANAAAATNLASWPRFTSWDSLHQWSVEQPGAFWGAILERLGIVFRQPPSEILNLSQGPTSPQWLVGSRLNIAESCFQASEQVPAIVWGNSGTPLTTISYGELRRLANRVASGATRMGLGPGSRIAILMPMTPDAVALYLGLILAGCTVVSIADSFSAVEIQRRLTISGASAIACLHQFRRGAKSIDLYARVVEAQAPQAIVITEHGENALREGDVPWEQFLGSEVFEPVACAPDQMVNILFSSGTTGDPKAIPWDQTTPIKAAADGCFHQDIHPGDVVVWPTNLGWMMGPWLIFASLMNRATIGLYGDAPSGLGFGRFIEEAKVTMLGVVPTLVRGWRASACMEGLDWSTIRCFSSTGEASNPDDMTYLSALAQFKPIIEYCGGTEIGGGYITSTLLQPNVPAAFSTPALGNRFVILDDDGQLSDQGQLYLVPPCVGLSRTLLNRDHQQTYYADCPEVRGLPPLRRHGDYFTRLSDGYYIAGGRADDTMNLGGIKVSSAEIESVLNRLPGISETAAVAVPPTGGGPEQLVVYTVLAATAGERRLKAEMNRTLKEQLNPLFRVAEVVIVDSLPRTASNKVMRRELRRRFDEQRARPAEGDAQGTLS